MTKTCKNCALRNADWVNCDHNHKWYNGDCEMWEAAKFIDAIRAAKDEYLPKGGAHLKRKETNPKEVYIDGGMYYAK